MSLSYMELLYLTAYWILVYEYVVMRHKVICAESDARMDAQFFYGRTPLNSTIWEAQKLYILRGTK